MARVQLRSAFASVVGSVLFAAFWTPAYGASSPDVWRNLNALPERVLFETVVTKQPETIDVTVARIPLADAPRIDRWHPGWNGEMLDPNAKLVAHVVSVVDPQSGSPLQHRIALPALPAGLYQVRLSTAGMTAIQYLSVSSISAMLKRGDLDAIVMAFDLRTMRLRRDVTAVIYTSAGIRTVKPFSDGLLHFPRAWLTPGLQQSNTGGLAILASDGSMAAFAPKPFLADPGQGSYLETDRQVYRPGERMHYRFISLAPVTDAVLDLGPQVWTAHHVSEGAFVLPRSAAGYYDNNQTYVTAAHTPDYQIEVQPLRFAVTPYDTARFVISATHFDGRPIAGLRLYYAYNGASGPSAVRLGRWGDAMLSVPTTQGSDVELTVYGPDAHTVVATASVQVRVHATAVEIDAPGLALTNRCYPIAILPKDERGIAQPNRALIFYDRFSGGAPFQDLSDARDGKKITTGSGGYAITHWCAGAKPGVYWVGARDEVTRTQNRIPIMVGQNPEMAAQIIWALRDSLEPVRSDNPATALSSTDGDALVLSGSDRDFNATVVPFENGVTSLSLASTRRLDELNAEVDEPTAGGQARGFINVPVSPTDRKLHVAVGCLSGLKQVCVRVASAGGQSRFARLFVDVRPTSKAGIIAALNGPNAYQSIYQNYDPESHVTMLWQGGLGTPATSYLYSRPNASVMPASVAPSPIAYPALVWLPGVSSNRNGYAVVPLRAKFFTGRLYLVHVLAVSPGGDVGEGYSWARL